MFDATEQLVLNSEMSIAVLGKGEKFYLAKLTAELDLGAVMALARLNDYGYCGVIGITQGDPIVCAEPDASSRLTMVHAALSIAGVLAESLTKKAMTADWCERLYSLPDTRPA